MEKKLKKSFYRGFTLVEVMVAMVVLAIGLLGMAGVTLMVIKGGTDASRMTFGTNLVADKMESLKDKLWSDLGTGATCTPAAANLALNDGQTLGCASQGIMIEPNLNQQGQVTGTTGATGPYPFIRKYVVCVNGVNKNPNTNDACSSGTDQVTCDLSCNPTSVPSGVTCTANGSEVGTNEKKIKILVAWRDKSGRCHKVDMKSVQVNLQ